MPEAATPSELSDFPIIINVPVQWGDMDSFGHVNNTVLFRWFESARIAYLERSDIQHELDQQGLGPILASINCNYRRQLHYPDTVWIGARVSQLGRSSITMEHAVYSQQLQTIAADGRAAVVVFNYKTSRPTRIPQIVRAAVEKTEGKSFSDDL